MNVSLGQEPKAKELLWRMDPAQGMVMNEEAY